MTSIEGYRSSPVYMVRTCYQCRGRLAGQMEPTAGCISTLSCYILSGTIAFGFCIKPVGKILVIWTTSTCLLHVDLAGSVGLFALGNGKIFLCPIEI
jgi:hypothetical protein